MPFYLRDRDISLDIAAVQSVLIVPCRFCPAASLAVRERKPYIELFGSFLRTPAYETYIQVLKSQLESKGVKTDVFDSKLPHQFVVCMWTSGRREELARQAAGYDAVIVLGCEAAVETVRSCLPADYRVIPGMEAEGVMSVIPSLQFPFNVSLEVRSVTRVLQPHPQVETPRNRAGHFKPSNRADGQLAHDHRSGGTAEVHAGAHGRDEGGNAGHARLASRPFLWRSCDSRREERSLEVIRCTSCSV